MILGETKNRGDGKKLVVFLVEKKVINYIVPPGGKELIDCQVSIEGKSWFCTTSQC